MFPVINKKKKTLDYENTCSLGKEETDRSEVTSPKSLEIP